MPAVGGSGRRDGNYCSHSRRRTGAAHARSDGRRGKGRGDWWNARGARTSPKQVANDTCFCGALAASWSARRWNCRWRLWTNLVLGKNPECFWKSISNSFAANSASGSFGRRRRARSTPSRPADAFPATMRPALLLAAISPAPIGSRRSARNSGPREVRRLPAPIPTGARHRALQRCGAQNRAFEADCSAFVPDPRTLSA